MFYTYLHRRESDNKPFYIGKGQKKRAWSHNGRNPHWSRTVAKHGLKVEVCAEWPTEDEAFEHEKFLIACFKDLGYELVNKTCGGEGLSGMLHSDEAKAKISKANRGLKRSDAFKELMKRPKSEEHKALLAAAQLGKKASESSKLKRSESHKKLWLDPEYARRMSESRTGLKRSEQGRKNISESLKGHTVSEETREKISKSLTGVEQSEDRKKKSGVAVKKAHSENPSYALKISAASKSMWADPKHSEKLKAIHKANWADPEFRAKMLEARATKRAAKRAAKSQELNHGY